MKKIICLLLGFSCSAFALEQNPIAPPAAEIVDKFGVNLQSNLLSRKLNTVSIGGELGLSHSVELYTDLFAEGNFYGYVDAFAGTVTPKNISENSIQIMNNTSGDPLFFRDSGTYEYDYTKRISVMRPYGPAGSQDFLVYQNGVLNRDASAVTGPSTATGITFKVIGDPRHTLVESPDKSYLTWTTPDGVESKYASFGRRLVEVTYPNGYKVRVAYKGVTTNTGFMLKYQLNNQGLNGTSDQIVAINRANQYCSPDADTCTTTGWPIATFTWPVGIPSIFWTPGIPLSNYLVKLTTPSGVTEIQYEPANMCITNLGYEDTACSGSRTGLGKWSPRLRSIKTPESTVPNYQYTYQNIGTINTIPTGMGQGSYWYNTTRNGQIVTATLNGTDQEFYGGPSISPGISTRYSSNAGNNHIVVEAAQNDFTVINSVWTNTGGRYDYYKDARHFVEFYTPIAGRGPKQHFYYDGPRGNLSKINAVSASGAETLLKEATGYAANCTYPKTCNKPTSVKDARGNVTDFEYDPQGRFGSPIKITAPADKNGVRPATVYSYTPMYAYYKKDGESIAQDPDPVWMLSSEFSCHKSAATTSGCANGSLDMIKTDYYYGPQSAAQANNLLLRGKSVTADGTPSVRVTCYEYDKYGKLMGETSPKGNSTNLQSCP